MDLRFEVRGLRPEHPLGTNSPLHCLAWVSVAFLPRQAAHTFPCHVASHQGPHQSWGPFSGAPLHSQRLPLGLCLPAAVVLSTLTSLVGFCFPLSPVLLSLCPRLSSFVIGVPPCLCFSVYLGFISKSLSGISHSPRPPAPAGRHSPQPPRGRRVGISSSPPPFWAAPCGMWDLHSPTRDGTCTPCTGSAASSPLDHQGRPSSSLKGVFLEGQEQK